MAGQPRRVRRRAGGRAGGAVYMARSVSSAGEVRTGTCDANSSVTTAEPHRSGGLKCRVGGCLGTGGWWVAV